MTRASTRTERRYRSLLEQMRSKVIGINQVIEFESTNMSNCEQARLRPTVSRDNSACPRVTSVASGSTYNLAHGLHYPFPTTWLYVFLSVLLGATHHRVQTRNAAAKIDEKSDKPLPPARPKEKALRHDVSLPLEHTSERTNLATFTPTLTTVQASQQSSTGSQAARSSSSPTTATSSPNGRPMRVGGSTSPSADTPLLPPPLHPTTSVRHAKTSKTVSARSLKNSASTPKNWRAPSAHSSRLQKHLRYPTRRRVVRLSMSLRTRRRALLRLRLGCSLIWWALTNPRTMWSEEERVARDF